MESVDDMQMMQVLKRDWCLDKVIRDRLVDKEKMKQLGIKSDRLAEVLAVTELACNAVYFEGLVLVRGGGTAASRLQGETQKQWLMTSKRKNEETSKQRKK